MIQTDYFELCPQPLCALAEVGCSFNACISRIAVVEICFVFSAVQLPFRDAGVRILGVESLLDIRWGLCQVFIVVVTAL